MQPGEFAVRYKDFKTGIARNPDGQIGRATEICRIFPDPEEAHTDSRKVVNEHWVVVCAIYDHTGAKVATVSNTSKLNKYAAAAYASILLWLAFCALVGMAAMWLLYKIWVLFIPPAASAHMPSAHGWLYWVSYAAAGLLLMAMVVYLRIRWSASRHVSRMRAKLSFALSPEDKKRFQELNDLPLSRDSADRERFAKLTKEYEEKIREALKK